MSAPLRLDSFVGGAWRKSANPGLRLDLNPSDSDDVVAEVPEGTAEDAVAAVVAAAEAFPAWRNETGPTRAECLYRWSAAIAARHEEIAQALTREVGKPIAESRGEVGRAVVILRYFAGEAVREIGEVIPAQVKDALQFSLRQPVGVVALITPWNFPIAIPLWKIAPAIAFGNTVVLKPAEAASHTAVLLAETAKAAAIPDGVFNVALGRGTIIANAMLRHEAVRAVSFTGSAEIGKNVAAVAAGRNIRFQTEMGGKNVAIVLADADLDLAAKLTASGAMRYAGQKCTATSRVIVAKTVADAFYKKLKEQVEALPLGPVTDASAAVGPLISAESLASVRKAFDAAPGRKLVGGAPPTDPRFAKGFFFTPAVVTDVPADSELAREELFGPVLAGLNADDLDHALRLANDNQYGLSATLFTRDLKNALSYLQKIDVGLVRVNGDTTGVDPHAPFGGMKGSSSGTREQGSAAREFYTEIKTVQLNPA